MGEFNSEIVTSPFSSLSEPELELDLDLDRDPDFDLKFKNENFGVKL